MTNSVKQETAFSDKHYWGCTVLLTFIYKTRIKYYEGDQKLL